MRTVGSHVSNRDGIGRLKLASRLRDTICVGKLRYRMSRGSSRTPKAACLRLDPPPQKKFKARWPPPIPSGVGSEDLVSPRRSPLARSGVGSERPCIFMSVRYRKRSSSCAWAGREYFVWAGLSDQGAIRRSRTRCQISPTNAWISGGLAAFLINAQRELSLSM